MKVPAYSRYELDPTKLELDHSDPVHGLVIIIGRIGCEWVPAMLAFEYRWWRWN